jgi:hypothetical protein
LHETWFVEPVEHLLDLGISGNADGELEQWLSTHRLPLTATHVSEQATDNDAAHSPLVAARRLGLDQEIGSLSSGKRADLILARSPARSAVSATLRDITAAEVEMVCIDGRIKKRNGVLTEPNEGLIRREGAEAIAHLGALAEAAPDKAQLRS